MRKMAIAILLALSSLAIAADNDTKLREEVKLNTPFPFENFEWTIKAAHSFKSIGSEFNPQTPKKGRFVLVEIDARNISNTAQSVNADYVLIANGKQYEKSTKGHYAEKQMGYEDGYSARIEPGITKEAYWLFDAPKADQYKLVIRERLGDKGVTVNLNKLKTH